MTYHLYRIKNSIENVIIYPFIIIGRLLFLLKNKQKEYDTFFFFPFYHTGGAEKVHAFLAQATGGKNSIIYFTRKSADQNFYADFQRSGCTIKDISTYTDNKLLYFNNLIFRGYISAAINSQKNRPILFNGQCNFGYKISPWINKNIAQVELIHSFNTFSSIRIPFLPFITTTIMISRLRIEDHLEQYKKLKIPSAFNERIVYIVNGIELPKSIQEKDFNGTLKVLYAGRGTVEKRVQLIAKMAQQCAAKALAFEFLFMGDVADSIPKELRRFVNLLGHKSEPKEIDEIYQSSHIVIITSDTEGFPLVIEEGMARGCAVMATPVGDIPYHIKNNVNGFLFTTVKDESLIVKEAIDFFTLINKNREIVIQMGERNIVYAMENFSLEAFAQTYRNLFQSLRNRPI